VHRRRAGDCDGGGELSVIFTTESQRHRENHDAKPENS
jgi:hypothetical protein